MFKRDKQQQPDFLVYRPHEPNFARSLAQIASSENAQRIKNYSLKEGLKTVISSGRKVTNNPAHETKAHSQDNFCSRFVIESIVQAASLINHERFS
ncbi:hypothetical protein [Legionella jamestowniensis]|uniref:Uncharacterized protein n=1 Tax=Legionella jamestowniensis TaxID=455 RepID=A0A0W0UIG3_9GAMM|nr:hypothetical protein [Legionella jamestowniensis]KTD07516.1 hypothetical protein Ljam_1711 [Legionella jamestowniensis]SFM01183.1 hypothetical protein SAMN02746073_3040 [Legionella jamestowniensis DSM 19215]